MQKGANFAAATLPLQPQKNKMTACSCLTHDSILSSINDQYTCHGYTIKKSVLFSDSLCEDKGERQADFDTSTHQILLPSDKTTTYLTSLYLLHFIKMYIIKYKTQIYFQFFFFHR